jgi:hypothetical protein
LLKMLREVGLHLLEALGLFEEVGFERIVYAIVLEGGSSCGACSAFALVDARLFGGGTFAVSLGLALVLAGLVLGQGSSLRYMFLNFFFDGGLCAFLLRKLVGAVCAAAVLLA